MPNWKKVVTSGSAAAFSSLVVSSTITGSISGSLTGSLQGTASWATNASTSSFAPNYLLTSSFNTWTGSDSSQFSGTSSFANYARLGVRSGSLTGIGDLVYHIPFHRNIVTGLTGSVYSSLFISSTGILAYSSSLDRLLTTASWAVNALTASYAENAPSTSPQGNTNEIQYNVDGTNFGGVPALTYDGTDLIGTGRFDGNLRLGLFRGTPTNIPPIATKGDEVLVYSQYIPAGTFTDGDVMRIYYRISNKTNDTAKYRIYLASVSDFSTVSGSLTNLIAETAVTFSIQYFVMKRDLVTDPNNGRIYFANSGSSNIDRSSDDIPSDAPMSSFLMDWNNTDYWMFFSALPGSITHTSKANGFTIERV